MLNSMKKKSLTGFTLIEVLVSIFIVTIGAFAVFALTSRTITISGGVNSRFVALYLAQEGIELVRNTRDTNFLEFHKSGTGNWDDGFGACASGCQADYNDGGFIPYDSSFLLLDVAGF